MHIICVCLVFVFLTCRRKMCNKNVIPLLIYNITYIFNYSN